MAIRKVEAIPFAIREPTERELAYGKIAIRRNVAVFIEDDSGLRGMAETTPIPYRWGCEETVESVVAAVNLYIAPLLEGEDPTHINMLLDRIAGRVGDIPYARSGICEALYDLCGKLAGVPVHRMLGGACHAKLAASWSIAFKGEREMGEEAAWAAKRGFKWIKVKIGSKNPAQDVRNVAAVREAVGPDHWIHVDANAGYSYPDAVQVLPQIEQYRPRLIEQPVAGWDLGGMSRLRRKLRTPLMADESVRSYRDLKEVIRCGAADAVLMKLNKHGGIRESQKIADLADSANMTLYPGVHFCTSIGVAAHAQFYCTLPRLTPGDFHQGAALFEHDLVRPTIRAENGEVAVPAAPGMGVELANDLFERARTDRGGQPPGQIA
ncbi:MAG: mandelate racemase/muconate lactonizing enzyme family protein [Burkholderiales bacterium]|nr:mandelate racemase/muconate lactonizing enzyme family protein [Burkholderiales bacterium]